MSTRHSASSGVRDDDADQPPALVVRPCVNRNSSHVSTRSSCSRRFRAVTSTCTTGAHASGSRRSGRQGSSHEGSYDLRHTYATFSLAAGVSLFTLSRRMGTSVEMIDRTYGHLAPDAEK